MSCCASSGDQFPPEVTVAIQHPHPIREASVVIVTCESPWLIRLYAVGRSLRMTANGFGISLKTASAAVRQVSQAISNYLGPKYLHLPEDE
ncbi:hypothetical protein P5673_012458 [Acropora cervicornis]|uniref:Uncharacterized protein n=1 Tax=Acropora cervicornis TaxID=6130 RepID=A0AAD9V7U2_ACRCE|nr:hypothetical protein P5673_012458 [Acropora cervicornis]